MTKPRTKHFALREWEGHGPCPKRYHTNVQRLMNALEVVYGTILALFLDSDAEVRCRITKGGGYRSPKVNRENKGRASRSQHLFGRAADMVWEYRRDDGEWARIDPAHVYWVIHDLQQEGRIPKGGLAAYPTFVHYDIRGRNARWRAAP